MKNKKGFSLVELLAVIALMGIIALIGIAAYGGVKNKIINENCKQISKELLLAGEKYTAKTGSQEMTVQDLIDAGLLSATDTEGNYKGPNGNDLSCIIINTETQQLTSNFYTDETKTSTTTESKSINAADLSEWLGTIDCGNSNENNPSISSDLDFSELYKLVLYKETKNENNNVEYSELKADVKDKDSLEWSNYSGTVYAVIEKTSDFSTACTKAQSSYKADTVFNSDCTFNSSAIPSLVISNLPELKGTVISDLSGFTGAVYAVAFDKPEGKNLKFEFNVSGSDGSGKKNDVQYYLSTKINIDYSAPEVKPETNENACFFYINVSDSLSKVKTYSLNSPTAQYSTGINKYSISSSEIKIKNKAFSPVDFRYRNISVKVADYANNSKKYTLTGVGQKINFSSQGKIATINQNECNIISQELIRDKYYDPTIYTNNTCIKTVYFGEPYGKLPTPIEDNNYFYEFAGWDTRSDYEDNNSLYVINDDQYSDDASIVDSKDKSCEITLYARWKVYLQYNENGVDGDSKVTTDKCNYKLTGYYTQDKWTDVESTGKFCVPSRNNFNFLFWETYGGYTNQCNMKIVSNDLKISDTASITTTANLYPQWQAKFTFNQNESSIGTGKKDTIDSFTNNSFNYTCSDKNNIYSNKNKWSFAKSYSDPSLSGYIFNGWYTSKDEADDATNYEPDYKTTQAAINAYSNMNVDDTGNVTLYAGWVKPRKYTLTYTYDTNSYGTCKSIEGTSGQTWSEAGGGICTNVTSKNYTENGQLVSRSFSSWWYKINNVKYYLDDSTSVDFTGDVIVYPEFTYTYTDIPVIKTYNLTYEAGNWTTNCRSITDVTENTKWINAAGSFCVPKDRTSENLTWSGKRYWRNILNGKTGELTSDTTATSDIEVYFTWDSIPEDPQELTYSTVKRNSNANIYLLLDGSNSLISQFSDIENQVNNFLSYLRNNYYIQIVDIIVIGYGTSSRRQSTGSLFDYDDYYVERYGSHIGRAFSRAATIISSRRTDDNNYNHNYLLLFSDGIPCNDGTDYLTFTGLHDLQWSSVTDYFHLTNDKYQYSVSDTDVLTVYYYPNGTLGCYPTEVYNSPSKGKIQGIHRVINSGRQLLTDIASDSSMALSIYRNNENYYNELASKFQKISSKLDITTSNLTTKIINNKPVAVINIGSTGLNNTSANNTNPNVKITSSTNSTGVSYYVSTYVESPSDATITRNLTTQGYVLAESYNYQKGVKENILYLDLSNFKNDSGINVTYWTN